LTEPRPADEFPSILERVNGPEDLRQLTPEELEHLCKELRTELWDTITAVGGHLAASLGVVELTVALHYVYDTPRDKLIWDVGHQGYIHKILTGRRALLSTIRQYKGLSGFLKRSESEYDTFGAGHASTSLSAAYGMAVARDLRGEDYNVVAIIGDGGMTGGLAFEALNNAGPSARNFTIVLNDNRMSISPNVGAVPKFLMKMESNPRLGKIKDEVWRLLGESPVAPKKLQSLASRVEGSLKSLTQKGKGYEEAELDPVKYHGVKAAPTAEKIEPKSPDQLAAPTMAYMDIFGEAMIQETARDSQVVAITAAMKEGTGLVTYSETYPDHFFDVGIAEGHAVTFAAGMAVAGIRPVAAIYSTFLQRAYDHIVHDCALQHLPVVFCLDRGGLVGEDGPTHHGILDLAYLSSIQGMVVAAPRSGQEMRQLIRTALLHDGSPFAIRYPRDKAPDLIDWSADPMPIPVGSWELLREGRNVAVLAVGTMVETARRAITHEELNVTLVNCRFVKPMDTALLEHLIDTHDAVLTLEEGTGIGGFGAHVALFMLERGYENVFKALYLPDQFIEHGSREKLLELCGLSETDVAQAIHDLLDKGQTSPESARIAAKKLLTGKTQSR
jgi:1-deoxy-D-xylulose-5-phosphate synthase